MLEPSEETIRNLISQTETNRGDRLSLIAADEHAEQTCFQRLNRQLKVEREIHGKAAIWLEREPGTIPPILLGYDYRSDVGASPRYAGGLAQRQRLQCAAASDAAQAYSALHWVSLKHSCAARTFLQ